MGVTVEIDHNNALVTTKYFGEVLNSDLTRKLQLLADLLPPAHYRELIDTRDVQRVRWMAETIASFTQTQGFVSNESLRVIVAPSDANFGIARMVQLYSELRETRRYVVTRSMADAAGLLAVDLLKQS
jgi:hypothetical protein